MSAPPHDDRLEDLAATLRERLVAEAGAPDADADLHRRIRGLVDREAGILDETARAALAERIAERSFGLGPLEPLLRDPEVEEVMVSGAPASATSRSRSVAARSSRRSSWGGALIAAPPPRSRSRCGGGPRAPGPAAAAPARTPARRPGRPPGKA